MYCPVRNDALDGEHRDVVTNAFVNCTPFVRQGIDVRRFHERVVHEPKRVVTQIVNENEDDVFVTRRLYLQMTVARDSTVNRMIGTATNRIRTARSRQQKVD